MGMYLERSPLSIKSAFDFLLIDLIFLIALLVSIFEIKNLFFPTIFLTSSISCSKLTKEIAKYFKLYFLEILSAYLSFSVSDGNLRF